MGWNVEYGMVGNMEWDEMGVWDGTSDAAEYGLGWGIKWGTTRNKK